ncbi:MAG: hypothetical protein DA408_03320 [Bacteroidetes bacterium]|nr:MAG: hypothetical protein C7N36_00530 [Bacteroidota bacterium]PTM14316.1 MAG: hypothetical protein DA408_03320 [Bacteroidota bacterium]
MKRFFLLPIFLLLGWGLQLQAQTCDVDTSLPDSVIVSPLPYQADFPERGIQDTACVDGYYETTIQVNIPNTITIGTSEIAITQVQVTDQGITNLPAAFDYSCNPPNCVFTPSDPGCIQIYGTATAADVGVHDLKINVLISTGLGTLPYTLPDGSLVAGNYFFTVQPAGSPNCLVGTENIVENAFGLRIQPNPFSEITQIAVDLPQGGAYNLRVFNAIGIQVQQKTLNFAAGQNNFEFDGSDLPVGMYIFSLQQGDQAASGRLLIQR